MFSHASVILFTIGLMDTQSLLILVGYSFTPCYGAVGTHPTGMLSCYNLFPPYITSTLKQVQYIQSILGYQIMLNSFKKTCDLVI